VKPPLFDTYPLLRRLPWIELGEFPTPIQKLDNFGEKEGFSQLYIKCDNQSSRLYGGNKVRKLEFVLADAKQKGRKTLITSGRAGSNQVLASGIYGKKAGFKVIGTVRDQPHTNGVRQNLLLDHHYSIELHYAGSMIGLNLLIGYQFLKQFLTKNKPYLVPNGASSPLGNIGFVNAIFELKQQIKENLMPEPHYIIAPAGSMGTVAGLEVGCRLSGIEAKIVAVRIGKYTMKNLVSRIKNLCNFIRMKDPAIPEFNISSEDLILLEDYLGKGYASITDLGISTMEKMKELENITLDTTYTAKALGGGLNWIKNRGFTDSVVLFWNTYNSVDLTHISKKVDYHQLPKPFHKYFEKPTQEEHRKQRSNKY
jgi:1-aminocyclopropane-1-carboxylate deaminase/D-cysteine desulfhydrase-like pyridoxal-dependent ACC family enzyme